MSGSLAPLLLRISAAVDGDGGTAVRSALQAVLQDRAPFDGGELVYARIPGEHASFLLGDAREAFLGSDLVEHVLAEGSPFRIDDWRDAAAFPDTLERLRRLGLRSALVLPFRFAEPEGPRLRGALAVARRHGWAFVGASLPLLVPVAAQAGLSFDHALRLSALGERAQALETVSPWSTAPSAGHRGEQAEAERRAGEREQERDEARAAALAARAEAEAVRIQGETARHDGERVAEALREARDAGRALRSSLEGVETARLEVERSRNDWAQQAASLRTRTESQAAEIRELTRGMTGARETAAAAADLAEAREVRIRELEAEVQRVGQERDRAVRTADEARQIAPPPPPPPPLEADTTPARPEPVGAASGRAVSTPEVPAHPHGSGRHRSRKGRPA